MERIMEEEKPRTRRRSHKKSSKAIYERNRRYKRLGLMLLFGAIGVALVAGLAVLSGGGIGN